MTQLEQQHMVVVVSRGQKHSQQCYKMCHDVDTTVYFSNPVTHETFGISSSWFKTNSFCTGLHVCACVIFMCAPTLHTHKPIFLFTPSFRPVSKKKKAFIF